MRRRLELLSQGGGVAIRRGVRCGGETRQEMQREMPWGMWREMPWEMRRADSRIAVDRLAEWLRELLSARCDGGLCSGVGGGTRINSCLLDGLEA